MPLAETLDEAGDADFDAAAEELVVEEKFKEITQDFETRNLKTHEIYARIGKTAIVEPRTSARSKVIAPGREYSPLVMRNVKAAERRALGGLSIGQRMNVR
jgi:hypothetical protein